MTKAEREARIKELEKRIFFLQMKDFWSIEDSRTVAELEEEIRKLEKEG